MNIALLKFETLNDVAITSFDDVCEDEFVRIMSLIDEHEIETSIDDDDRAFMFVRTSSFEHTARFARDVNINTNFVVAIVHETFDFERT